MVVGSKHPSNASKLIRRRRTSMTQHARLDWKLCENQQMGVLEVIEEDESEFVGLQKTETCGGSDHSVLLITKRITKLYPVKTGRNSKLNVTKLPYFAVILPVHNHAPDEIPLRHNFKLGPVYHSRESFQPPASVLFTCISKPLTTSIFFALSLYGPFMSSSRPELRLPSPSAIFDEDGGDGLSFAAPRASAIATSHSASSRLSSTIRNHPNVSEIITRSSAASNNRAASAVAGSSTHTITPNNVLGSPSRSIRTERGNAPSYKKKAVNSKRSQCDIAENPTATQDVKMRKSAKKESADLKPFAHVDQMSSSQVVSSSSRKRGRPHGTDNATKVIESGRIKREHGIKALSDGEARFEPSQAQQRQLSDAFLMQQMQMDKKVRPQQLYQKKSRHALSTLDKTTIKPSWSATSVYKRAKKAKIGPMHKRPARSAIPISFSVQLV